jgi:hypothetical protein
MQKKWYISKTIWVNAVGLGVLVYQAATGFVVPAEYQAMALTAINAFLRVVTKEEIVW